LAGVELLQGFINCAAGQPLVHGNASGGQSCLCLGSEPASQDCFNPVISH
jgi:hypothetical protein